MRYLIILVVFLSACGSGPSNPDEVLPDAVVSPSEQEPTTPRVPDPTPTPTPTPTATPCATFSNGNWVADASGIVPVFNNPSNSFTETYNGFVCTRLLSSGVPNGAPLSLVFPDAPGSPCNGVPGWIQFEITSCNKMLVLFRNGSGIVLGTGYYTAQ